MKTPTLTGFALLAIVLGGCNTVEHRQTKMNTSVVAASMAMYTQGSCWAWETPEVSVATPPSHGRVTHALVKRQIHEPGSKCHGQPVEARVSTYTPNPGFRGQDKFSLNYQGIWNDAGARMSMGKEIVVDVQ